MPYTIIRKLVAQLLHPLGRPLLRSVTPSTRPLLFAPRIPHFKQAIAPDVSGIHDGIGMVLGNTTSISLGSFVRGVQPVRVQACSAAKKKLGVDVHQFFGPEFVLVQDVARHHFGRDAAREILNGLTRLKLSADGIRWTTDPPHPTRPPSMAE